MTRLTRLNERFIREGKKPLKSLDDLPKDYQEPDPYLDETVNIALDLAHKEKSSATDCISPCRCCYRWGNGKINLQII